MKTPFPYPGGKSRIAETVWQYLGDPTYYIEPFIGSGAVLLNRPKPGRFETVNDAEHMVVNFWRAVSNDAEALLKYMDFPSLEEEIHARHYWLLTKGRERLSGLSGDPDKYDVQAAGYYAWCMRYAIANRFCQGVDPWHWNGTSWEKRQGGGGLSRNQPETGRTHPSREELLTYLFSLQDRLRGVRVLAGDWSRCMSVMALGGGHSTCGVFLDPPYAADGVSGQLYANESKSVSREVREWCLANGDNPLLRIILCGYEGEHEMPSSWRVIEWKGPIGYASREKGEKDNHNRLRERLWLSPYCSEEGDSIFF